MEPNKDLFAFVDNLEENTEIKNINSYTSAAKDSWKRFIKNKTAITGLIIFGILLFAVIVFPLLPNYDALSVNSSNINQGPSSEHWWGTDANGRDFWSRNWGALQYSLLLALISTSINIVIAIAVGLSTGYFEKWDRYFGYVIKVLYALPSIIVLILFSVIFSPSFGVLILSLIVTGWVNASQQIRGVTLKTKNLDFVTASQTLGTKRFKIMRVFFSYALPIIITQFVIIFPRMIISESILGFLGLSIPDIPTLGNLINDGRGPFLNFAWQLLIPLGLLGLTTISIQLIGFGVEDALGQGDDR